ncbi:polyphosphate--glucose phosphotransferase [Candidatus Poriferisocius sp.]|uniref:polyphosphate--glucose phosphotransferase n=1 Tax=Candidatus Poriferisocius sp. TaxID=3101276 RepID=UPI003B5B6D23
MSAAFGIDIGGTGMKAAPVDVTSGELLGDRNRIPTPKPGTPEQVAEVVAELVGSFGWSGPVGCAYPAPIVGGTVKWVAHLDDSWAGVDIAGLLSSRIGAPVTIINDADAAGTAEMHHGAGVGRGGTVCFTAFGTGIGSSVFVDGTLVPNTEFGHMYLQGHTDDVEVWSSAKARERDDLDWPTWAGRVRDYLQHLEKIISPGLFILGGGISKRFEKWGPLLELDTEVLPARMRNNAGIVGAAMASAAGPSASSAPADGPGPSANPAAADSPGSAG